MSAQQQQKKQRKTEQQQQLADVADINDVTTGKKVAEPMAPDPSKFPEPIPEGLQKMFARSAEIMSKIKTDDQPIYETKIEGSTAKECDSCVAFHP